MITQDTTIRNTAKSAEKEMAMRKTKILGKCMKLMHDNQLSHCFRFICTKSTNKINEITVTNRK